MVQSAVVMKRDELISSAFRGSSQGVYLSMSHPSAATVRMLDGTGDESPVPDPWELVWGQPYIDSEALAAAIEADLRKPTRPDFRTRLLVRDAADAIRSFWGSTRFARWLRKSPVGGTIKEIIKEDLGAPGFPTIRRRLVDSIHETQVKQI